MEISIELGDKQDLEWAQETVEQYHYLHRRANCRSRLMVYIVRHRDRSPLGLIMVGLPHATKCRGWWGYPGYPTQWQVLDLCRIYLSPIVQFGGALAKPGLVPGFIDRNDVFRPTVASWAIEEVLNKVGRDWVSYSPPVFLDQPYHIRIVISYHDPAYHSGSIYRYAGAQAVYTDKEGSPLPGPSGKYCWAWHLPRPSWEWHQIKILRSRNIRMDFKNHRIKAL
ncbi:MAG: hypothetical protein KDJ65_01515 [Anaerolineae bacterium]|nr:hypothetical protein [Anaerolineae bacterium]